MSAAALGPPADRARLARRRPDAPAGLGGTKSLQDLFTDARCRARCAELPVVEAGGEIVWVAGVAVDERFAAARRRRGGRGPERTPGELSAGSARRLDSRPMDEAGVGEILVQRDDLAHRVRELAEEISRDYEGRELLLVGVLKGAVFFLSDLMRHLEVRCEVDFMAVSSYGSSTDSLGRGPDPQGPRRPDRGPRRADRRGHRGLGSHAVVSAAHAQARDPASLEVCALLTKPERRKVDLPIRYTGFEIPNRFVIGYGLDHAERFRNLPYVAVLAD